MYGKGSVHVKTVSYIIVLHTIIANAVQMEVYTTGQIIRYIASQGPMQHTTKDLWQVSQWVGVANPGPGVIMVTWCFVLSSLDY